MKVLIVEDYDDTREMLEVIFGLAGHSVLSAADGEIAVHLAAAERPDAIVMDLALPRCDGVTAARRIKALPWLQDVAIVAHTAKADMKPGYPFAAVLSKPCAPDLLLATVETHVPTLARIA